MSPRFCRPGIVTVVVLAICSAWSVWAGFPAKLSEVISAADLEAEAAAKINEIETGLASQDAFQSSKGKLRLAAAQLAALSQALVEHDESLKLRSAAPALRDAAIQFGSITSFDEAQSGLVALRTAFAGNGPAAKTEFEWSKLARTRLLMESLRDRADQIRKALRKSKDPLVESRHASVMAVLGLLIASHSADVTNPSDRPEWTELSLEFQREMTQVATALRKQDTAVVLDHFKAAQAACDRCHEKFKK